MRTRWGKLQNTKTSLKRLTIVYNCLAENRAFVTSRERFTVSLAAKHPTIPPIFRKFRRLDIFVKKYILLTLILTIVVIGPFVHQKWSEAKRLRHIIETKQLAAQIQAIPLTDYRHRLKQLSPDSTHLLLFTGNTQAQLEPCGCFIGQSGGLPKRAKSISHIRENGFSPLLVDLGGIQPSQPPSMKTHSVEPDDPSTENGVLLRDQHRMRTTLTAMKMMGYDVVFLLKQKLTCFRREKLTYRFYFWIQI